MAASMDTAGRAEPGRLQVTGERIQALLDASAAGGALARERSEELVRQVADLYGAGLERLLDILYDAGRLDDVALEGLVDDELVAGLLLVHGLHPHDLRTRVQNALESVRPYLGSHGGDVELLGVSDEGVVRLRLLGSCDGCPSSSVTLKLAVEGAVEAAAPEVTGIEVETADTGQRTSGGLIPPEALRTRIGPQATSVTTEDLDGRWEPVAVLADLEPGQVRSVDVAGVAVVVCRVGTDLYAYHDNCPRCRLSLASGSLARRLGGRAVDAVLVCSGCRAHYDVRRAGAGLDGTEEHLAPLPLLLRDGGVAIAVPGAVTA